MSSRVSGVTSHDAGMDSTYAITTGWRSLLIEGFDFSATTVVPREVFGTIVQHEDIEGSPHFSLICLQHSCSPVFMDAEGTAQRIVGVSRDRNRTTVSTACAQGEELLRTLTGFVFWGH